MLKRTVLTLDVGGLRCWMSRECVYILHCGVCVTVTELIRSCGVLCVFIAVGCWSVVMLLLG